jgi:hypothetical protein
MATAPGLFENRWKDCSKNNWQIKSGSQNECPREYNKCNKSNKSNKWQNCNKNANVMKKGKKEEKQLEEKETRRRNVEDIEREVIKERGGEKRIPDWVWRRRERIREKKRRKKSRERRKKRREEEYIREIIEKIQRWKGRGGREEESGKSKMKNDGRRMEERKIRKTKWYTNNPFALLIKRKVQRKEEKVHKRNEGIMTGEQGNLNRNKGDERTTKNPNRRQGDEEAQDLRKNRGLNKIVIQERKEEARIEKDERIREKLRETEQKNRWKGECKKREMVEVRIRLKMRK